MGLVFVEQAVLADHVDTAFLVADLAVLVERWHGVGVVLAVVVVAIVIPDDWLCRLSVIIKLLFESHLIMRLRRH